MLWVRLRKGVGFLFFFSQLLLFSEPYTANDTRHFAAKCLVSLDLNMRSTRCIVMLAIALMVGLPWQAAVSCGMP